MLFDETTLRKITRLALISERVRAGRLRGARRSTHRGSSLEFADTRFYTPGDDLRRVDWRAYARLDRPFLKLFEEEEDLAVHLLVDASRSMDWGAGEAHKFTYGLKLAAALGAIALASGDPLWVSMVAGERTGPSLGPLHGQAQILRLLRFLEGQAPDGTTDLDRALRSRAAGGGRPGFLVLISDLLSPGGFFEAVFQLQARGHEILLLQLLSPDELDPPLAGDLRLVDVETGTAREATIDAGLRGRYRQRLQGWQAEIRQTCSRRGLHWLPVDTGVPWDRLVLQEMRAARVLR